MKLAVSRKPCLAAIKHYAKPFVQHKVCHGLLLYLHNALVFSYVECSEKVDNCFSVGGAKAADYFSFVD